MHPCGTALQGCEINGVSFFHIPNALCQVTQFICKGFNSHISVFFPFYQLSVFEWCSRGFINDCITHMLVVENVVLVQLGLLDGCIS